jgi:hypothetical protein
LKSITAKMAHLLPDPLRQGVSQQQVVASFPGLLSAMGRLTQYPAGRWIFRGQPDARWGLQPSIERLALPDGTTRFSAERFIRREFRRRAHHYLSQLPEPHDELAWLALMRHHGAPSRLLDWTRSPYVAAHFAAVNAAPDAAFMIWAVDQVELLRLARKEIIERAPALGAGLIDSSDELRKWPQFVSSRANFNKVFLQQGDGPPIIVAPVEPFHTSERMTVQQGLFLCSNSLSLRFEQSLAWLLGRGEGEATRLIRFEIMPQVRAPLLTELDRMNITEATLFPGLDGFARSLGPSAAFPGRAPGGLRERLAGGDPGPFPSAD